MEKSERNREIYDLKEKGVSFSEISRTYKISIERVRQIYFTYKARKLDYETCPPLKKLLTVRMQHGLINYFEDENIYGEPARIMSFKLSDYKKVQNVGKEALESLVNGMIALGYVKEGDKWLDE